jgi:hypothetical protein
MNLTGPEMNLTAEIDESTGGLHLEVMRKGFLVSEQPQPTPKSSKSKPPAPIETILFVLTVFINSVGVGLKGGRLLVTLEELMARAAINSTFLHSILLPPEAEASSLTSASAPLTKEEVNKAVLQFAAPLLFTDSHELSILLDQLVITALSPKPDQLEFRLRAGAKGSAGKVNLNIDIANILTDVLDILELQSRVWGQGMT